MSKKDYLRCLIVLDDLIAAGVIEFKSARANTFYSYILRYRKLPPAGASMKALKQAMDADDSELAALAAPMVPVPPPVLDRDPHIMLSDDEPSEAPAIPAPPPPPLPPPAAEPDPAAAEPELAPIADDIVADEPVDAAVPLPAEPHWPEELDGVPLQRVAGRLDSSGRHNYESRLRVVCPAHLGCSKSRSTALMVRELGPKLYCASLAAG